LTVPLAVLGVLARSLDPVTIGSANLVSRKCGQHWRMIAKSGIVRAVESRGVPLEYCSAVVISRTARRHRRPWPFSPGCTRWNQRSPPRTPATPA